MVLAAPASACTAFCLKTENSVVVGKNLDWGIAHGYVIINPRGQEKLALTMGDERTATWTSGFGSVTFNQFGAEFPLGGINESGLVVEELNYTPGRYPYYDGKPDINELQWIQYQLDNFSSVEQVLDNLEKINIKKLIAGLHFFICDGSGQSAVIEFIDGQLKTYTGTELPVPVLTNNTYANAMGYLKKHVGFGGDQDIRYGPESPVRFAAAAHLIRNFSIHQSAGPEKYAHMILDSVSQIDTQWRIVYDISKKMISFRVRKENVMMRISLEEIVFNDSEGRKYFDLDQANSFSGNILFKPLDYDTNRRLVDKVMKQMVESEGISARTAENLKERFLSFSGFLKPDD